MPDKPRGEAQLDIQSVIVAINADLTKVTADRLFALDPTHVYLFKSGFDGLSESGSRAIRLSPFEIEALFYDLRQRRIDAALQRMADHMGAAGVGSAAKSATGYAVTEGGATTELTEAQFVTLAREHGYIAKDDPYFCVDSYRSLAGWDKL